MVLPNLAQNPLILQGEPCGNTLAEKGYFAGQESL
jgi:hypothetical protein